MRRLGVPSWTNVYETADGGRKYKAGFRTRDQARKDARWVAYRGLKLLYRIRVRYRFDRV